MKQIVFYIEGGSNRTRDGDFRRAFHQFFSEIETEGKLKGCRFSIVLGGSRTGTYDRFCQAVTKQPDTLHVLLVDSEGPVAEFGQCWKHLKERAGDKWDCPSGMDDTHCHLMVEAMEAWFFADADALAAYYGQQFNVGALPKRQNVEEIPKATHIPALEAAAKPTQKGHYDKFRHAPEILMKVDVRKVRDRAAHCDRIFTTLAALIADVPGG